MDTAAEIFLHQTLVFFRAIAAVIYRLYTSLGTVLKRDGLDSLDPLLTKR